LRIVDGPIARRVLRWVNVAVFVRATLILGLLLGGCNALTGATDFTVDEGSLDPDRRTDMNPTSPKKGESPKTSVDAGEYTYPPSPATPNDGGEPAPEAEPAPAQGAETKRVFVSSTLQNGNLGGLSGADQRCNQLAQAAGLPGTFMAWLSTDTVDAKARMTGAGPWSLVGETEVAVTRAQLETPPISRPIRKDERGNVVSGLVWTGTNADGRFLDDDCGDWTAQTGFDHAATGDSIVAQSYWTAATPRGCQNALRIYCFQL
jgi:hypothetical protein